MRLATKQKRFAATHKSDLVVPENVPEQWDADFKATKDFVAKLPRSFPDAHHNKAALMAFFELASLGSDQLNKHYLTRKDTPFSCTVAYYDTVARDLGFEKVGAFGLDRSKSRHKINDKENVYVYARPDGMILTWDTYGDRRNSAHLYFQWKANDPKQYFPIEANGACHTTPDGDKIFVGYKHASEGLRGIVNDLTSKGVFVTPWRFLEDFSARHFLTVEQDYSVQAENKGIDSYSSQTAQCVEQVNKARSKELPFWVRQMTGMSHLRR